MSPLRRVEAGRAGPGALGILVPPGRPTVLILRPRALPWDLLLVRAGEGGEAGTPFLHLERQEAEAAAEGLIQAKRRKGYVEVSVEEAAQARPRKRSPKRLWRQLLLPFEAFENSESAGEETGRGGDKARGDN